MRHLGRSRRSRWPLMLALAALLFLVYAASNPADAATAVQTLASHGQTIAAGLADFVRQVAA